MSCLKSPLPESRFNRNMLVTSLLLAIYQLNAQAFNLPPLPDLNNHDWICDSGNVLTSLCWDKFSVPNSNDDAYFQRDNASARIDLGVFDVSTIRIGSDSIGRFEFWHNDGTVNNQNLVLGDFNGASNTLIASAFYSLHGGNLNTAYNAYIGTVNANNHGGHSSNAIFTQRGGAHHVGNNLNVGSVHQFNGTDTYTGLSASYRLIDGQVNVGNDLNIGTHSGVSGNVESTSFEFRQTGGSHNVTGDINLGHHSGLAGEYILNGGSLTVGGSINGDHDGSRLYLGAGSLSMSNPYATINVRDVYVTGSHGLVNSQRIIADTMNIGSDNDFAPAYFSQQGVTSVYVDRLGVGRVEGYGPSHGEYDLNDGSALQTNYAYVGGIEGSYGAYSTAEFRQFGGTFGTQYLALGYNQSEDLESGANASTLNATYLMSGGTLTVTEALSVGLISNDAATHSLSHANFSQTGGKVTADLLSISYGNTQTDGRRTAEYNLNGGELIADTIEVFNQGSFNAYSADTVAANELNLYTGSRFYGSTSNLNIQNINQLGGTISGFVYNRHNFNYESGDFQGTLFNYGNVSFANQLSMQGLFNYSVFDIGSHQTLNISGTAQNSGFMQVDGTLVAANLSNYGHLTLGDSASLQIDNVIDNGGSLTLARNMHLNLDAYSSIINTGNLNLNQSLISGDGDFYNENGGLLFGHGIINTNFTNNGNLLVEAGTMNVSKGFSNTGIVQMAALNGRLMGGQIDNSGTIEGYGLVNNSIHNTGLIEARHQTLTLSGGVYNEGTLRAGPNAKLYLSQGVSDNFGVMNLNGGTIQVAGNENYGSTLFNYNQISGHGVLITPELHNAGHMTFTGGPTTIQGKVTNDLWGVITASNDTVLFTHEMVNQGEIATQNAQVTFAGDYSGNGSITGNGDAVFQGQVMVGNSPGSLHVGGDIEITETSVVVFEIGGYDQGLATDSGYDWINVGGVATLEGAMTIEWWEGFTANAGDSFELLTAETIHGEFDILGLADLGNSNFYWDIHYSYDLNGVDTLTASVMAVPEPSTYAMMLSGLGLVGLMAARRRRLS